MTPSPLLREALKLYYEEMNAINASLLKLTREKNSIEQKAKPNERTVD